MGEIFLSGASITLTSAEGSAATPFLARSPAPFGDVTKSVRTSREWNAALCRFTAPLPLTITFSAGSDLLSAPPRYRA